MSSIVYVPGTFDTPHWGHVRLFKHAATLGLVVVGLNTDDFQEEYKGRRPIMTLPERMEIISEFRSVDAVIVNTGGADSKPGILASECNLILHGDDWTGESYLRQLGVTQDWLDKRAITIVHWPYTQGISTTEIVERCRAWEPVPA